MKDLISLHDLTSEEVKGLLELGLKLKKEQKSGIEHHILKGKTLGMIFTKSSTRTRVSFEVGMTQLGGYPLFLSSNDIQLGRGESIYDTAKVLERMLDGIMIRTYAHQDVLDLAEYANIPVINALTDLLHPCQVLADLMTTYEHKGKLEGLKLAYIGDGNNMAHSLMYGCAKAGMDCAIATPENYQCDAEVVANAKDDFKKYLPDQSLCNLCSSKDDKAARIVFSTYPTMLNAIDNAKTKDGVPLFSPAHFDLIIVDESHRSIFKKYRAIFDYFDAVLVGLTATPKTDVDRNTYDFFEMEHGIPTYAYDYDTAVYTDHVLVPYYNYEVKTKFTEEGIHYDQLSPEDKARYEDDFAEDDTLPTFIPSEKLNKFIFNANTVDTVLQDLMERGIQTAGGDRIGKTIIFAQNKRHAEFIRERFGKLYPQLETQYPGFIQRVVCDDAYAQSIIDDFKQPDKPPFIAVSVDMMDTGIDVPECVNLVFFKKVRSKTKFWQMIGRGTRLCPSLACVDAIDGEYTGKRRFLIFDYCGNFEFFRQKPNGYESADTKSLSESIFCKQVRIAAALQDGAYGDENYQNWRKILTETCRAEVGALNPELVSVRLHRQAVEHYQKPEAFVSLTETDKGTLMKEVAPLISLDDKDEAAKRFDNFVYGLLLCELEGLPGLGRAQKQLRSTAAMLEGKATIPQVQAKLPLIREVQTDEFLTSHDLLRFEEMRQELRELIKFLVDGVEGQKPVYTALADPVLEQTEGKALDSGYDFGEYRERVNRYIMEHRSDTLAIHKLTQNIPLSRGDYTELEHIFTCELGSKEDYAREFRDTPFGLLVRKVAKLDHDAAMQAFSKFINDESLNAKQIAFVQKVIHYIEQNGYVESKAVLMKPPFDQPILFTRLFDGKTGSELMDTINSVKENATHVTA